MQARFVEQLQKLVEDTGREQLTMDEEDIIFEAVMDPPSRNRRYGFGNQVVMNNILRYKNLIIF